MSEIIIQSKLQKPDLPVSYISKKKVLEGLSSSSIALVCAQAGTGKSSLVSDWLSQNQLNHVWVNLDPWDKDLNQFLTYIGQGLSDLNEEIGQQLMQLTQNNLSLSDEGLIKGMLALFQNLIEPCCLVLDDYHHIREEKIHNLISALLNHLPSNLSVCIISREDPPLHLGKLRAQHKLYELRSHDLKFNLDEADKLFKLSLSDPLTEVQTKYFYQRSEGWVAGLQLISMTLQNIEDVENFIKNFSGHQEYIMAYLLEEVLEKHLPSTRAFLFKTSIFTYFNHDMCAYVLEMPYDKVVEETKHLLKSNSFLLSLNKGEHGFRYHQLFKALLKEQRSQFSHLDTSRLYQRAGYWFEKKENYQEAINYYLEGEHFDRAQALIEKRYAPMDMALRSASWLMLAKRLPRAYIESSPVICVGYGWAMLDQGDIEGCQDWFEKSKALYEAFKRKESLKLIKIHDSKAFEEIPITLLCAKAYIAAIKGAYEALMLYTDELNQLAIDHSYSRQWIIESFVGMMHWGQGHLKEALKIMTHLHSSEKNDLNDSVKNAFIWIVSEIYIQKGELTKAKLMLEKAIEDVHDKKTLPFLMSTYHMLLSLIESIRGHKDKAYEHLEISKDYGYLYEFMDWRYKYHLLMARLALQDQLYDEAKAHLKAGKKHTFLNPVPEAFTFENLALWLLMLEDVDEHKKNILTEEAIEKLKASSEDLPSYLDEMYWKIIMSQACVEAYGHILYPLCQKLLKRARHEERTLDLIEYILISIRYVNDPAEKAYLLNQVKAYAKKEEIIQPFIEFSQGDMLMEPLKERPFEIKRAKINKSLREPLTLREIEMLTLIAKGFSNQEIADTLLITLSTVKSYNNRLFSKLDVKRRTEAVAKGKKLGLLK